jgi:hypothetical protein
MMGASLAEASKSFHRAAVKSPIPTALSQKPRNHRRFLEALSGTRTPDPFLTMEVLYQLS